MSIRYTNSNVLLRELNEEIKKEKLNGLAHLHFLFGHDTSSDIK